MALPSSGQIKMSQINVEMGLASNATNSSLSARSLTAGKSTPDKMSDFYGYVYSLISKSGNIVLNSTSGDRVGVSIDVTPNTMETSSSITSGSFFTISGGSSATGDFTLEARSSSANNSGSSRFGSITISDDAGNADDLVVNVEQQSS